MVVCNQKNFISFLRHPQILSLCKATCFSPEKSISRLREIASKKILAWLWSLQNTERETPININLKLCVDRLVSEGCFQNDLARLLLISELLTQPNLVITEHLVLFLEAVPKAATPRV